MPQMKSLRSFRLATLSGHIYQIKAGEPIFIHPQCVGDAMQQGCVPVDEADMPFIEDMERARSDFHGDVRRSLIYMAIDAIMKDNNLKEFGGSGQPKHEAVAERLGIVTNAKEISDMFQLYTTAKSEGKDIELHPEAHMALRVIEATSRRDLDTLASEMGVAAKDAKGLDAKALRKLLLSKVSGASVTE